MNIGEMQHIIKACDTTGTVPLIEGKHGIGKSQITMQYAKDNNMHCEQLILSLMDTGDLLGIPVVEKVGGATATVWAAPDWYQRIVNAAWPVEMDLKDVRIIDGPFQDYMANKYSSKDNTRIARAQLNEDYCSFHGIPNDALHLLTQNVVHYNKAKRSILFLDEFNRAPADILNASLQLILDKRLHSHVLPVVDRQPTVVVAAINPDGGNYTVSSLDPALLDRFLKVEADVSPKEWLAYARSKGINVIVRDFITENTDKLWFEPADGGIGATPRSWEQLSKFIDINKDIKKEHQFTIIKGLIGSAIGSQFLQFFNNYSKAVKFVDIEKQAKELLKKHNNDLKLVAEEFSEARINDLETVQQMELAAQFYDKYINKENEKALPLLAFLYAMPLEQAAAFILGTKDKDEDLEKFAQIDSYNNKTLLKEIFFSANKANTPE